ncbi:uncharacterized protein ARMOST_03206 [Armillaria ostoyae]|uniref:Uncharacterized protein n=1 Tax=Armillaria ostoyae TaxID=47428 RepID=A0A284QTT5_ARMOS|nr:uncharacterized protein ARMOST_03206 [Armillaria ostoyae]
MAGTYELSSETPRLPHTPLSCYPEQWYCANLTLGWMYPIPASPPIPLLTTTSLTSDQPPVTSPPTVRIATLTLFTPSPLSELGSETPHPPSERMMTSSISTASNMSGLPSFPSTSESLVPSAPKPGSYEDAILRLVTLPEALTTASPWTSTLPMHEETRYPVPAGPPPSRQEYLPTENTDYMALPLAQWSSVSDQGPPRSSTIWRSPYTPSPWSRATASTWMDEMIFDCFVYDNKIFGRMVDDIPYPQTGRRADSAPSPHALLSSLPINRIQQHGQYHGQRTS